MVLHLFYCVYICKISYSLFRESDIPLPCIVKFQIFDSHEVKALQIDTQIPGTQIDKLKFCIRIYSERFIASAITLPFRGEQVMCFGACDTCAANQHTGHPHPRGCGARTSSPGCRHSYLAPYPGLCSVQAYSLLPLRHDILGYRCM